MSLRSTPGKLRENPTCERDPISYRQRPLGTGWRDKKRRAPSMFRGTPFLLSVILLGTFAITPCQAIRGHDHTETSDSKSLQRGSIKQFVGSQNEQVNVLLQEDGSVEAVKVLFLQAPEGTLAEDVIFTQASSNEDVLKITDNSNILVSTSADANVNVTCTLVFDSMVGKTDYSIVARKKDSNEVLGTATIPFIIVGMSFFTETADGVRNVVSGDDNGYFISYEEVLSGEPTESKKIRVLIQYPDGSSTTSISDGLIPFGESMQPSMSGYSGQFLHQATLCNNIEIGNQTESGNVALPAGCGFGFFSDAAGNLFFGVLFQPYRVGTVTLQYSWSGITSTNTALSADIFEFTLNLHITGNPPVTVVALYPSEKIWRPEGGEIVRCEVINTDLRNASSIRLNVTTVDTPFNMLHGSYASNGAPNFTHTISFVTESGSGTDLGWIMEYGVGNASSLSTETSFEVASVMPGFSHVFNYDSQSLRIDSLQPNFGSDEGGEAITISGYFPFFNPNVDGIFFSGFKLPREYIVSVSPSSISILSPSRSVLGESFEFLVTVHMGKAVSSSVLFSFILKNAVVRVSQSGTSEIDEETYRVGDCTPVRFTAVVTPFTNQIQGYQWTLHLAGDSENELLQEPAFTNSNSSAQTLELDPDAFEAGVYTLKIVVNLLGKDLERELLLVREHIISIGAFILNPPERTIAYPDTPLRLSAVVKPPGECYTGNQTMIFEWTAFGEKKVFSSTNATGSLIVGNLTTTPARLGWEYVVPREKLIHGNSTVQFKVWMAEDESVFGQAMTYVYIQEAPLVPVIRHGEEQITVNYLTTLTMFATRSYDPDVINGIRTDGLTYEWQCLQSSSNNFSEASPCGSSLLPDISSDKFSVPMAALEAESDILFLKYILVVRKGMERVSPESTLVVEIQNRGTLPFLDDYEILLTNDDGTVQEWDRVAHYERSIISVSTSSQVSWSYSLIEPLVPDFFSAPNLINNPIFFSADANVFTVSGNTKPLGIEAGKLSPHTTYKFKILFDGSAEHEATSVVVSIRTEEAPIIGFPVPSVTNGTQHTTFTATAGIPRSWTTFSYYFILTDHSGKAFCVGGCTGYDVVHFRVGRVGTYSLTAYIFDMQGKALLDSKKLATNITVIETETETQYLSTLETLFENGDDNTWTQMAHDLAQVLLQPDPTAVNVRMLAGTTEHASSEDIVAAKMQYALSISAGSRKIFCSSYPNSYHGSDCMSLSSDLAQLSLLDTETVYNLMTSVQCCVENTPDRTINKMGPMFPAFLQDLNRLSRTIDQGGNSRRRLLQSSNEPANLLADVQSWTGRQLSASITSGKLDGYTEKINIGADGEFGQVSIVVASNPGHIPVHMVNGEQRRTVMGPSKNELFYASNNCLPKLFAASADKKRYFVLHTLDNFVLEGFQDPPQGSNLADKLYWQQVYEKDTNGRLVPIELAKEEPCFCWRLPVIRQQRFLDESVEYMAGMYTVANFKDFGVDVLAKGEAFNYVYEGMLTSEYNATQGWVEACQDQLGMVSSTLVTRTSNNAIGSGSFTVVGTGGLVIVGLVLGGLVFVVVAMASAWIFATRAMSDVTGPLAALAPNELYVERDVYGRGTIFDVNAVSLPSN